MGGILEDLNVEQRQAVECVQGPVLIVAGAGSGKTRVLTSRVAYLIEQGVDPGRILSLTFTKKAATEMKDRIALMVGERKARRIWMGTFHSIFIRFLREFADRIGFPPTFTIYDTSDSVSAVKTCIRELQLDDKIYKPKEVLSRISKAKNDLVTPTPYRDDACGLRSEDILHKKPEIYRIYARYCEICRQSGVMDFDDILLYLNILLKNSEEARSTIASRFDHILVDEYQDTNVAQYLILKKLAKEHRNLCVVGDDSQSIYAFRGAQIRNILNFRKDFPEAKTFRLERNYRSTRNIVNAANSLISKNENRIPKNCVSMGEEGEKIRLVRSFNGAEEASLVSYQILDRIRAEKAEYKDFAILFRTNSQSRVLEEKMRSRNIPYKVYGNSFYDRAEVKDVLAYLRLVVNPLDMESLRRVVNRPARGIGDTSMAAWMNAAAGHGCSLFEAAEKEDLEQYGLRNAAIVKIRSFCRMIAGFHARAGQESAFRLSDALMAESGMYTFYRSDTSIEGQARLSNVEEVLNGIASMEKERQDAYRNARFEDGDVQSPEDVPEEELPVLKVGEFLEEIALLSNIDTEEGDEVDNKVSLMTVHSAKGLEFKHVFVTGMEENIFPSGGWLLTDKDLEEERRLFYVALTRAMKTVTLCFAENRFRNGKEESNSPSRFLREIAPQYLLNPLRKEGNFVSSSEEDSPAPGFRWTSLQRRPEKPVAHSASREEIRSAIAARPKPPVTSDPTFVPDPMSSFHIGDRIEHNRFGKGKVLEISGQVPELKARIVFDAYGEKLLLLKFAKIRHI